MKQIFCLSDAWQNISKTEELIPFGVGRIGRRVIPTLMKEFNIPFLIDNGERESEAYSRKIMSLEKAKDYLLSHECKIVVTTVNGAYIAIKEQLEQIGLKENIDFCLFERFVLEWNLRWANKCVLSKIDTVITTKCTLRCQHCNMFISCMDKHEDITVEELKGNFDVFFKSVDYVYEYTLLGGEPFLHSEIGEIIKYLGEKYRENIGKINIITNGTVVPSPETLDVLQKYGVMVNISDYTKVIPYEKILKEVEKTFGDYGIDYYTIPNNVWKDVIYPRCEFHTDNPRKHMMLCGHGTHSVDYGKLYWCDPAFSAEKYLFFQSKEDDSLDLERNRETYSKYEASLNIVRYILGDVNERGYMTICEKCAGIGWDNDKEVVAGVQK